ncbi:endoplasmic oxidoreductin [Meredithblackwellia eburnea MCA 4105]
MKGLAFLLPLLITSTTRITSTSASALSALDRPRQGFLQDVLESNSADQKYCKPTGLIQDACCDFETVESVNNDIFHSLHDLVTTPFFRYHKVDLYRECPFWQEEGSCMNRACGVETTEEEHIPEPWRSTKLGEVQKGHVPVVNSRPPSPHPVSKLQANTQTFLFPIVSLNPQSVSNDSSPSSSSKIKEEDPTKCDVEESDFCVLEDEMDSEGQYVDLLENPERFTGYAGESSARVWKAIYEENCFTPVPFIDSSRSTSQGGTGFASLTSFGGLTGSAWGESEKKLFGSLAGPRDGGDEVCLEKRVFYRLISGLHASISIHICDDYLDQTTGEWSPNLQCFITRIAQHPERLQNVYFTYVVALRALSKAGPKFLVRALDDASSDEGTKVKFEKLVKLANGCPSTFDETSMFSGTSTTSQILKTEFKEHFRNVSRIMDCVGCDKCRLWGKLQVTGLGTALKLLFSLDNEPGASSSDVKISRGELVAFINVLHRLSESLAAVEKFREMWATKELEAKVATASSLASIAGSSTIRGKVGSMSSSSLSSVAFSSSSSLVSASSKAPPLRSRQDKKKTFHPAPLKDIKGPPIPSPPSSPARASSSSSVENNKTSSSSSGDEGEGVLGKLVRLCRDGWKSCFELVSKGVQEVKRGVGRVEL